MITIDSERAVTNKKIKRRQISRVIFVSIVFIAIAVILIILGRSFFSKRELEQPAPTIAATTYAPTIVILDEDAAATGGVISGRMKDYIGQAEADFKDLGYTPQKAVLPTGTVREIHLYLSGYTGFIKMTVDRPTAVSVEDADRMIRYLATQGITDFSYIDVRIDGKAYWK